ncbi:MAG: hypothetical protein V2A58_16505 [Planctomycetota bacterium]
MKKKPTLEIDFEIAFYEGVLARHPAYVEVLKVLGHLYTERGFFEKGLALDRRLVRLLPADPVVRYNLACSCALTAQPDSAFEALERAFELGYRDWQHMEKDRDLESIRRDNRYGALVERMRRGDHRSKDIAR